MDDRKAIKEIFAQQGPILTTKVLRENGFYNQKLQKLIEDGTIEQIRRGYYQLIDENSFSDVRIITSLFPDGVLCMESALDYYGYTERTPDSWQIAVDGKTSRTRFRIPYPAITPHFIASSKFTIGISRGEIEGTEIRVYDRERTICDCLTHRNKMDAEVFNDAIRNYLNDANRKESVLASYAPKLRVERKVMEILGIWL